MPRGAKAQIVSVAALVAAVDQLTKRWALEVLDDQTIDLVWTLRLRLLFNKGSAFGFGSRFTPLITLLAIATVIFFFRKGAMLEQKWPRVAIALIVGGALGNLIDRLFRPGGGFMGGAVVDFFDLQWWPVFNVADIAISIGAVLLVLVSATEAKEIDKT